MHHHGRGILDTLILADQATVYLALRKHKHTWASTSTREKSGQATRAVELRCLPPRLGRLLSIGASERPSLQPRPGSARPC